LHPNESHFNALSISQEKETQDFVTRPPSAPVTHVTCPDQASVNIPLIVTLDGKYTNLITRPPSAPGTYVTCPDQASVNITHGTSDHLRSGCLYRHGHPPCHHFRRPTPQERYYLAFFLICHDYIYTIVCHLTSLEYICPLPKSLLSQVDP
jgi:hypothetical protein